MFGFGAVPAGVKYYEQNNASEVTAEYCNQSPWAYGSVTSHAAFWYVFRNTLDVLEIDGTSNPVRMSSASSKGVAYSVRCVKE